MIDEQRAIRAFTDVLAVEWDDESGVANIVTLSDSYMAVPELRQHNCPDREYHLDGEGMCKHLAALEITRGNIDAPEGWLSVENLDERTDPEFEIERPPRMGRNHTFGAFTDGGETDELPDFEDYTMTENTPMTDGGQQLKPEGHDKFTLWDSENSNARHFDSRATAEDKRGEVNDLFPDVDLELFPPGDSPDALIGEARPDDTDDDEDGDGVPCAECGDLVTADAAEFDAGNDPYHPECSPTADDSNDSEGEPVEADVVEVSDADAQPVEPTPDAPAQDADLPDRSVADDPLTWIPGDFVDEIDGTQAVNRKGFEVLSHFYDIGVSAELQVPPEDTGHEYARVKATATTPDGRECQAFGSAHVDRGDDKTLLLEMADTRARKRALSIATGVGAVAVAELRAEAKND